MKSLICTTMVALCLAAPVWAHDHPASASTAAPAASAAAAPKLDEHTLQDIERHRGMAQAHQQAAQCLAEGKSNDVCQKQLQASCKGLALGKNCGMRHAH